VKIGSAKNRVLRVEKNEGFKLGFQKYGLFHTDDWESYKTVIPHGQQWSDSTVPSASGAPDW
jgi:hypothetical protein